MDAGNGSSIDSFQENFAEALSGTVSYQAVLLLLQKASLLCDQLAASEGWGLQEDERIP
jgi:hypothetical protein